MASDIPTGSTARPRSLLRAVAVPAEHGGWGLTAEPVLLGLLVAPSLAGVALGVASVIAFLVRTPLKVALVDRWRRRRLERTILAARVAAVELALLGSLVAVAALRAGRAWWLPLTAAVPLVAIEASYDMRSRSRRLVPELCGAVGVASVAAAIARAGGSGWAVSLGLWLVLAARSIASIPFARAQVQRIKSRQEQHPRVVDAAQAIAVIAVAAGLVAGAVPTVALVAVALLAAGQIWWARRPPPRIAVLGAVELVLGLGIVAATAGAIRLG